MFNSRAKNWFGGILLILGICILTFPIVYDMIYPTKTFVVFSQSKPTVKDPYTVTSKKYQIVAESKQKDWTEYGDKIVGWLSALSGSIVLLCEAKRKMEEKKNG